VKLEFGFLADQSSLTMSLVVSFIALLVLVYSRGYMGFEESQRRYYSLMCLFASSMLFVVLSGNFIQLYFFWGLMGICSYFLIGFWHNKDSAAKAARKALLIIAVGDMCLLGGIILIYLQYQTFNFLQLFTFIKIGSITSQTLLASILIFLGAATKSALFPFHVWLPDAMEGPTPVSTFLHSATMVKAGLFLILRLLPLFIATALLPLIVVIAVMTIAISALHALFENDIKRVLAYSTINQLGFIALALGLAGSTAALFQIINHAFFKALLFMFAGIMIHATSTQDITAMRRHFSAKIIPIAALFACLSLAGLFPLNGFWSKEMIFGLVWDSNNLLLSIFFALAVFLSALYIFRWFFIIFNQKKETKIDKKHEVEASMKAPLPILGLLVVFGGIIIYFLMGWFDEEFHVNLTLSILSTLIILSAIFIAHKKYHREQQRKLTALQGYAAEGFRFEKLYYYLSESAFNVSSAFFWIDKMINRLLDSIIIGLDGLSARLRLIQTGRVQTYVTAIVMGFVTLIAIIAFMR
jgi:NADH-quinone oxidoreductase subunit L